MEEIIKEKEYISCADLAEIFNVTRQRIYQLMKQYGITKPNIKPKTQMQRFMNFVRIPHGAGGCWLWIGAKTKQGYGWFNLGKDQHAYAHRYIYEQSAGKIPSNVEIDHLCREEACVNPLHLELVTHRENVIRGMAGYKKETKSVLAPSRRITRK